MPITLADLEFLQSDVGLKLLACLATADLSESNTLKLITSLRQAYDANQVRAGITQARLRQKAILKFGEVASQMLFTSSALEQASDPLVRRYRANYCQGASVLDVCCGIGTDAMAMAQVAESVLGLDIDPIRVAIATHNATILGLTNLHFEMADVRDGIPDSYDIIFYDPARRNSQGKRIYDVERYIPPLSLIQEWQSEHIVVKLSPGVDQDQLKTYSGGVEFVSVSGDLKEAIFWCNAQWRGAKATLLTDRGETHHWLRTHTPTVPITEPRGWLVEPDAAIIRAGLVQDVAESLDGTMLDETIAYFCTSSQPQSVWVRSWEIVDWMPFNLKRLKAYIREHDIGRLTIKKRGSPLTPEELLKKLKPRGEEPRVLVLTRYQSQPIILICKEPTIT